MKTKNTIMALVLTGVIGYIAFYIYLPPLNIQSMECWIFVIGLITLGVVCTVVANFGTQKDFQALGPLPKFYAGFLVAAAVLFGVSTLWSSPIFRAKQYRNLISVQESDFTKDIEEISFDKIPSLDKASATKLGNRKMGDMKEMVSQFEVSTLYTQINFKNKPVRVTPLEYGDIIKWFNNRKEGIPAYMSIDMVTQNVTCVQLEQGMKYTPYELFGRKLKRYLRFAYPTYIFTEETFEVDEDGVPYWICPVRRNKIGLFGGKSITGAVLVNAVTGEHRYYQVENVPVWVDRVYNAELLISYYDYYASLQHGYLNSLFGQKDCLKTTEGHNYIALNDDVWMYTGVTSVGGDQSNVGFVWINQRTKEARYYAIPGAEEYSAMSSAEGQVQHLKYQATFPLLLNMHGQPTYFIALKDVAGLVKQYAMVNVEKYQVVAIGDTVEICQQNYASLLAEQGVEVEDADKQLEITGKIAWIKDIVSDGNTLYYIELENQNMMLEIEAAENIDVLKCRVGDSIRAVYEEGKNNVCPVRELQINNRQ